MSSNEPQKRFDTAHVNPREPFYLAFNITNADNTIDTDHEAPLAYATLAIAIEETKKEIRENGGETYIYKCYPTTRLQEIDIIVEQLHIGTET